MATTPNILDSVSAEAAQTAAPALTAQPNLLDEMNKATQPTPRPARPNLLDTMNAASESEPQAAPLGSQATGLSAQKPSVWDRIKSVFTEGIPSLSSRTVFDPKYGQMQLATPEAALTPQEQKKHPIATGVSEVAGGLTSPESVATIAATGGLGELGGAAGKLIPRLVSGGFSAQMIYGAAQQVPDVKKALEAGDYSEAKRLMTRIVAQGGLAALGVKHAVTGKGAVSGKAKPSEMEMARTTPVVLAEESSPLRQVVKEPIPEVRVVDSAAAKQDILAGETKEVQPKVKAAEETPFQKQIREQVTPKNLLDAVSFKGPEPESQVAPIAKVLPEGHIPVVSHDEVLAEAIQHMINNSQEMQRIGLDPSQIESRGDVARMLDTAASHIQQNGDPRLAVIGFEAQKGLARDLNMSITDLLSRKSGRAFSAEEAIASRALLEASKTNVMNLARNAATGDEAYQQQFTEALAQHKAVLDHVKGIAAEAGRALGSFNIGEEELPEAKISNALADLSPEAAQKAAQLLSKLDTTDTRQVNDFVEQVKPSTGMDKIFEYYRNALLSSPKTAFVKGASELSMIGLEAMQKFVASGLDEDRFAAESYYYARGAAKALAEHGKDVLAGKFSLADMPEFERAHQQAIKGKVGAVVRFPSKVLQRGTDLIFTMNYLGEIEAQAARAALKEGLSGEELNARQQQLVNEPTNAMRESANETALRNTFQQKLGPLGQKAQALAQYGPLKFIFPFVKTPLNLIRASAEYSPLGLLKGITENKLDPNVDSVSRALVGSSIAAGLALLAAQGKITGGGPLQYQKRQTLQATRWQPYSVRIGGRYISMHRLEPIGLSAGLIADTAHAMHSGASDEEVQGRADTAVQHIMRNVDDLPFMNTLSDLFGSLHGDPATKLDRFVAHQVAGFVPALVSNIAQGVDTTVRRPQTMAEQIQSRVPGMTANVTPALDITGRPVRSPESKLGGLNPFPVSSAKNDAVLNELARLGIATPQPLTKISIGKGEAKTTIMLSKEQSTRMTADVGSQFRDQMIDEMQSPDWQSASDEERRAEIQRVHLAIRKQAAMEYLESLPQSRRSQ